VAAAPVPSLVITFPTIGARVEGLDLDAAAQLFARLR
jgi:hypothetical protein